MHTHTILRKKITNIGSNYCAKATETLKGRHTQFPKTEEQRLHVIPLSHCAYGIRATFPQFPLILTIEYFERN